MRMSALQCSALLAAYWAGAFTLRSAVRRANSTTCSTSSTTAVSVRHAIFCPRDHEVTGGAERCKARPLPSGRATMRGAFVLLVFEAIA